MEKEVRTGIILKGVGGTYWVDCGDRVYACKAGGRLRLRTEKPVTGDQVQIETSGDEGYIVALLPRKNALIRPAIANIDQLFILASNAPPQTDPYLIDKVSVIALYKGITPVIVLNKCDLDQSEALYETYRKTPFPVLRVSAATGEGVETLVDMLADKVSAFTGNSGIGKSSILNRIDGRFTLAVGDISQKIERGKHTTRHVELLRLDNGGLVADTPGFSSFEITQMERIPKDQLQEYFPEIGACFGTCQFSDCAHIKEPGCSVRHKVKMGEIPPSRYESYCKLHEELAKLKDWE